MIDNQKILEILNKESVSEKSSNNKRVIIEQDFEIIAEEIVKLFDIPVVVGRSEQLKCDCKRATFTRTVDEDYNPTCGKCNKTL